MTTERSIADEITYARGCEDDARRWPEERATALFEAAAAWRRAGDDARAEERLRELLAEGGEDGRLRQVRAAELAEDRGDLAGAQALLDDLRAQRPLWSMACHMAAEQLEHRGRMQESLHWFNLAVSRCDPDEIDRALAGEHGRASALVILWGRRRVRQALGYPADALDTGTPEPPGRRFPSSADVLDSDGVVPGQNARTLFWQRGEVEAAHDRWPDLVETADGYYRDLEERFAEYAARGVRLTLVPATADGMAAYADDVGRPLEDETTRHDYMLARAEEGVAVAWPPPRNGPCWCGSGRKYKKCCGARTG